MSKLYSGMGGKEKCQGALGTIGTVVFLPTKDPATMEYARRIADKVDTTFVTASSGNNMGLSHGPGAGNSGWNNGQNEGTSENIQQRDVIDGSLFRSLRSHFPPKGSGEKGWAEAIMFGRIGGKQVDDVIKAWSQTEA